MAPLLVFYLLSLWTALSVKQTLICFMAHPRGNTRALLDGFIFFTWFFDAILLFGCGVELLRLSSSTTTVAVSGISGLFLNVWTVWSFYVRAQLCIHQHAPTTESREVVRSINDLSIQPFIYFSLSERRALSVSAAEFSVMFLVGSFTLLGVVDLFEPKIRTAIAGVGILLTWHLWVTWCRPRLLLKMIKLANVEKV